MKQVFRKIFATVLLLSAHCFTWGFSAQVFHLVDDKTNLPLVTMPSGEPEPFLAGGGKQFLFVGYFTKLRLEAEDSLPGEKFPAGGIGVRFKLRGEDRWVRVERWCCDEYNWVGQQSLPAWGIQYNKAIDDSKQFGNLRLHEFVGSPEALGCVPFANPATFFIDPKTNKPRWIKYFAVARQGWDNTYLECGRETWNMHSSATVGSRLDSTSVLVLADDADGLSHLLRVSIETGEILHPLPSDFLVVDAADVERFKTFFLQRNICPAFTPDELRREDRLKATATGRCIDQRRRLYEESVMRHFMGAPKPKQSLK